MTRSDFLIEYKPLIIGSYVEGFSLAGQFPVLELETSENNLTINFHLDCTIYSNNAQLNSDINKLSTYDQDVFEIAYFIAINRKQVTSISFSEDDNFLIQFDKNLELTFKLNDDWVEPMNISILENGEYRSGCRLFNDGTIDG